MSVLKFMKRQEMLQPIMNNINVCEIFKSIQGESTFAGSICSFVRLSGCNLRCSYCDTRYAFSEGEDMSIESILQSVKKHNTMLVEITGGEPLIQSGTSILCNEFLRQGYSVLVETNGSCDLSSLPTGCHRIVDVKCPGSGTGDSFLLSNLELLTDMDELKYVISDKSDFDWALDHILTHNLQNNTVLFSPNLSSISAAELASLILEKNAPVRLGVQLHKLIWGERRGV